MPASLNLTAFISYLLLPSFFLSSLQLFLDFFSSCWTKTFAPTPRIELPHDSGFVAHPRRFSAGRFE